MQTKRLLPIVFAVLLVACGGNAQSSPSTTGSATTGPATTGQPAGQVDCAAIDAAGQQMIAVQLLAQLTTPESVELVRSNQIGSLDLDAFLAALSDLHALDDFDSPLGDAKSAIEVYEKAAQAAKVLFATEPVTQAAIDTYNENVGTVTEFLSHQVAIAGAKDEAGC